MLSQKKYNVKDFIIEMQWEMFLLYKCIVKDFTKDM